MRIRKTLAGMALGSALVIGTAGFAAAAPQEHWLRGNARQEQVARDEIRRGELMEQEGRRMEWQGDRRRGEKLERKGEKLVRHGRQVLRQVQLREYQGSEDRRWR